VIVRLRLHCNKLLSYDRSFVQGCRGHRALQYCDLSDARVAHTDAGPGLSMRIRTSPTPYQTQINRQQEMLGLLDPLLVLCIIVERPIIDDFYRDELRTCVGAES